MSDFDYPEDLRYTAEHEWIRSVGDGRVRVGITAYAQDACGEIVSTKSVSDLYSPLTGEITAVNAALDATPELINSDPYGEGWCFEMSLADAADLDSLMDAAAYRDSVG